MLNLEYARKHINKISCKEINHKQYIDIWLKREKKYCTNYDRKTGELCGSMNIKNSGYYNNKVFHYSNTIKKQELIVHIPRYKCLICGMTFSEVNTIAFLESNLTKGTFLYIMDELKEPTTTFTHLAKLTGLSTTKIIKVFDQYFRPTRRKLPEIICIDEFYKGRHFDKKFAAVLTDWQNNKVIDIVDSRRTHDLENYFERIPAYERNNVKYVTCDFYKTYRDITYRYFPNARVVVDTFHLKQLLNSTLKRRINKVLFRELKKYTEDELESLEQIKLSDLSDKDKGFNYKFIKKYQRELYISNSKCNMFKCFQWKGSNIERSHQDMVDIILSMDVRLKSMYLLIQEFYDILYQFRITVERKVYVGKKYNQDQVNLLKRHQQSRFIDNWNSASNELDIIFAKIDKFETKAFETNVATFRNWKTEILNSMILDKNYGDNTHFTNSNAESNNAIIKQVLCNSRCIKNFDRFSRHCMYVINKGTPIKAKPENLNNQTRCKGVNNGKKYLKHN
jgi:transposase